MRIKHLFLVLALLFPLMGCNKLLDSMTLDKEDFEDPDWPGLYEGLLIVRSSDFEEKFQKVSGVIVTHGGTGKIWHSTLSFDSFPMDAGGNKTMTKLAIERISTHVGGVNFYSEESRITPSIVIWDGKEYKVSKLTGSYSVWEDKGFRRLMMTVILEDPKIVIEYDGRAPLLDAEEGN